MAKEKKAAVQQTVAEHISALPSEIIPIVTHLRNIILQVSELISEQIKWNSPSFYYNGEMKAFDPKTYKRDMVVMNLHRGRILLVLPTGDSLKKHTSILEGSYTDGRRMITIKDMNDAIAKEQEITAVIQEWLSLVEK